MKQHVNYSFYNQLFFLHLYLLDKHQINSIPPGICQSYTFVPEIKDLILALGNFFLIYRRVFITSDPLRLLFNEKRPENVFLTHFSIFNFFLVLIIIIILIFVLIITINH